MLLFSKLIAGKLMLNFLR